MSNARHAAALEQTAIHVDGLRADIGSTLAQLVDLDRQLAAIAEDRDTYSLGFWTEDTRRAAGKAAELDRAAARGLHARREEPGLAFLNGGPMLGSGRVVAPVAIAATSASAQIRYGLLHHLRRLSRRLQLVALELEQRGAEDTGTCPWPRPQAAGKALPVDATTRQLAQRLQDHVALYANRPGLQAILDDLDRLEETARDVVQGPSKSNHPDACPWCGRHSLVAIHREHGQPVQIIRCEGEHPCACDYDFCECHRSPRENRHEWSNSGRAANTWHQLHNLISARKEAESMEYRATEALEQIRELHQPRLVNPETGATWATRIHIAGDGQPIPDDHECIADDPAAEHDCLRGCYDQDGLTMHAIELCATCGVHAYNSGEEPQADELWPCPTYRAASLAGELE